MKKTENVTIIDLDTVLASYVFTQGIPRMQLRPRTDVFVAGVASRSNVVFTSGLPTAMARQISSAALPGAPLLPRRATTTWTLCPRALAAASAAPRLPAPAPAATPRTQLMSAVGAGAGGLLPLPRRVWRDTADLARSASQATARPVAPTQVLAVSSRVLSGERLAGQWLALPLWRPGNPRDTALLVAEQLHGEVMGGPGPEGVCKVLGVESGHDVADFVNGKHFNIVGRTKAPFVRREEGWGAPEEELPLTRLGSDRLDALLHLTR